MKLKVCGMRELGNIQELGGIQPDFMGLIFYDRSKRYVSDNVDATEIVNAKDASYVGVFVNASKEDILAKVEEFRLDFIQLHGDEPLEFGKELRGAGLKLIKVFGVQNQLPLDEIRQWEDYVEYFLFDTKTKDYGGSGKKFDWSVLEHYTSEKPFLLSGGLDLEDIKAIKELNINQLVGIDVNSRFEKEPGLKDIKKLEKLKELINE